MTVTKIGYSRVSTLDQNLSAQREALSKAGCKVIYEDQVSGKSIKRPKLRAMLDYIRDGDIVVVTRLDRLARSTKDLLSIAEEIQEKGAGLEVLNINLDTTTPTGKLMLTMLGAIAEFEREIMLERQREGIAVAKTNGKYKGRTPVSGDVLQQVQLRINGGMSVSQAASEAGIARRTYYKAIKEGRI
jgi:DNA invertase Pin-like site-specific DNA recombinase